MTLAQRILADLAVITSTAMVAAPPMPNKVGFAPADQPEQIPLTHDLLVEVFTKTPGLVADKLKATLEFAAEQLEAQGERQAIFAYDEAQNLSDHARRISSRSRSCWMFSSPSRRKASRSCWSSPATHAVSETRRRAHLRRANVSGDDVVKLSDTESREAIMTPIERHDCPVKLTPESVNTIILESAGYPYFIQFICREVYDIFIQQHVEEEEQFVPIEAIQRKLDADFFAGRWAKITDRQRELLWVVAQLDQPDEEFTIQHLTEKTKELLAKSFSPSNANQMLASLAEKGMIYKNRFGKYSFAVPLPGGSS